MKKVLIANRGEIAIRIIRACRELGLSSVAVHSLADKDSLHAKLADESVCIGPGPSSKSYLSIPAIMSAAELVGADAIHPGYGFLAENDEFARICNAYGIEFIGPTAQQISKLGNKVHARRLAQEAGVPLLPGTTDPVSDARSARRIADEIGYPVIIKAAAGGGGRGMKIVYNGGDIAQQLQLAATEAKASFGNSSCYIERYLDSPRHIEVQVLADKFGGNRDFGERDCSIQRRHQKVIEEAPAAILTAAQRKEVCGYALKLLAVAGYQSAGTVEFLFQENQFYFMEVNTRIQVEHPVTEVVSGVDLVKNQILIASGLRVDEISRHDRGHAIECRINAEDPDTFAPWPGKITAYHEPGGPGIRVDSMAYSGYVVPSLYDSMVAKVIAFGNDRQESIERMQRALLELRIEGIRTNTLLHQRILKSNAFIENRLSTRFLEHLLDR